MLEPTDFMMLATPAANDSFSWSSAVARVDATPSADIVCIAVIAAPVSAVVVVAAAAEVPIDVAVPTAEPFVTMYISL